MNTEQNYTPQNSRANTIKQTVESDQNEAGIGTSLNLAGADWAISTDTMYRMVSAQASMAIVEEVAGLFEKFTSKHITVTLQEVIIAYQENRVLDINEFSALVALLQVIPQLELSLLLDRK